MYRVVDGANSAAGGIQIICSNTSEVSTAKRRFLKRLNQLTIGKFVTSSVCQTASGVAAVFELCKERADEWAPGGDTTQLCRKLKLATQEKTCDLEREILVALLVSPIPYHFSSYDELVAAVHIRRNMVQAARKTSLAFATMEAERPAEYWYYDEDRGFILRPGQSLVTALQRATQPDSSSKRYTFSCRRATEYVFLLGIAAEAMDCNQDLYRNLHQQAETRALKGREFENVFVRQIGSARQPLPLKYFVPGDRTWFRNPDPVSSNITGYEGSWTFYLGDGLFADFWRQDRIFDLTSKCVCIHHWRNATYRDLEGELQIDESVVDRLIARTLSDPAETQRILQEMMRLQEPLDVYAGGCIEAHREAPREVCPGSLDVVLPDIEVPTRAVAQSVA